MNSDLATPAIGGLGATGFGKALLAAWCFFNSFIYIINFSLYCFFMFINFYFCFIDHRLNLSLKFNEITFSGLPKNQKQINIFELYYIIIKIWSTKVDLYWFDFLGTLLVKKDQQKRKRRTSTSRNLPLFSACWTLEIYFFILGSSCPEASCFLILVALTPPIVLLILLILILFFNYYYF